MPPQSDNKNKYIHASEQWNNTGEGKGYRQNGGQTKPVTNQISPKYRLWGG